MLLAMFNNTDTAVTGKQKNLYLVAALKLFMVFAFLIAITSLTR